MQSFLLFLESDKDDFFKHHYTGFIPSHSYENYEREGGLSWLGKKTKYPILFAKQKFGEYEVEFRKTGEKLQYTNTIDDKIVRDKNGIATYLTDEEIKKRGYPEFDQTIVAFVGEKPIGFVSNEFGAAGVFLEEKYQRLGIGTQMLYFFMKENPEFISGKSKIGQMTNKGINMTNKVYDKLEKEKGKDWFSREKDSPHP